MIRRFLSGTVALPMKSLGKAVSDTVPIDRSITHIGEVLIWHAKPG